MERYLRQTLRSLVSLLHVFVSTSYMNLLPSSTWLSRFKVPPLLLISLDGFRADFLQRNITPAIQRLMNCGTSAPYMFPSYPSKTFPNHYTIVTGLYPESHGIVDNYMFDETNPKCKSSSRGELFPECGMFKPQDSGWFGGQPVSPILDN